VFARAQQSEAAANSSLASVNPNKQPKAAAEAAASAAQLSEGTALQTEGAAAINSKVRVTTHTKKYTIYFRVDEHELDPEYQDNAKTLETMIKELSDAINAEGRLSCQIDIVASASPEGRKLHNEQLSKRRMEVVLSAIRKNIDVTDVTFHTNSLVEDWAIVAAYVAEDQQVPRRQEVLQVLNSFDGTQDIRAELKKIGDGAYDYILNNFFPLLRSTDVVAVYDISERLTYAQVQSVSLTITTGLQAPEQPLRTPPPAPRPDLRRHPFIKLKTNTLGLGLGHANIAVEYAFAEHFSVALPFYYSGGFDYFKPTLKFRGIVLQPEVRYYLKANEGFYVGAHLGLGWYNFALNGEFRIQDHRGRRPAFGGGLGIGYTLPFKKNPRWGVEFAIGAGVYDVKYDAFYNEPNGAYSEHGKHDTFFGVDNAAISFTYKFPIKKEGRR
jgi:outer membrane protein OmpA-like peptidoglycan-associated protein